MELLLCLTFLLGLSTGAVLQAKPRQAPAEAPVVELQNGSYYGDYNSNYNQDLFLGMPYAQPPVGDLRFHAPEPLNSSWKGERNATQYSPECFGYGSDTWVLGNYVSEDCLTINVVRPHGVDANAKLPVAVWIHGGGLTNGGSSDPRYNLSFIVQQSVKMRTPFIATSINYRLHAWGFLWSEEIKQAGAGNLGFRDQRLGLAWVQENIAAFGGDPDQVTVWGESAGATSVAAQILAYGGRDDGLFRSGIMESGTGLNNDFGEIPETTVGWQTYYDELTNKTNCSTAANSLQCLRQVPAWTLSNIINSTTAPTFGSRVDGDFVPASNADLVKAGKFVKVPIIIGTNFDEGSQFGQQGINTTEQWNEYIQSSGANNQTVEIISALYPDAPSLGLPATLDGRPTGDLAHYGRQWKRVVAYAGDKRQHAGRRWWARHWASAGLDAYTYHFNVLVNGLTPADGSKHFQEVAFVFDNTNGVGYNTSVAEDPYAGEPPTFDRLANIMSRMWVSFITDQHPNYNAATCKVWPKYTLENPSNIVFDVNVSSLVYIEPDTYRGEQIEYFIGKLWGDELLSEIES